MKEIFDENLNSEDNNNLLINNKELIKDIDIKKKENDNNDYEIITNNKAEKIKNEEDEIQKKMMYILNKDENFYTNLKESETFSETDDKKIEIIKYLSRRSNTFFNPNPLRKQKLKEKPKDSSIKSKKIAINDIVTNLKTQYIIFNIQDFIRKYHLKANPHINIKQYKFVTTIQVLFLYFYGIIIFFEKPWFCHEDTTFPLPSRFIFIKDCKEQVVFSGLPFIYDNVLRVIEIFQIIVLVITQIMKYRIKSYLTVANIKEKIIYKILQAFLFLSLAICFFDVLIALFTNKFPIFNFLIRPFIYIYMFGRLRRNWLNILKVIWKTKFIYLLLLINILTFSCIGYFLFNEKKGYFESLGESFLQLYILLTTCNFPDIMLDSMKKSKIAMIYFIIYISINIFIILSLLQTLYTNKYNNMNKKECLKIIKDLVQNPYNQHIFNGKKFNDFIFEQKRIYSLTKEEFDNILIIFNIYNQNINIFSGLTYLMEQTPETSFIFYHKIGKYILQSYIVEIIINLLCVGTTLFLINAKFIVLAFHFIISFLLLYEPILLIYFLGINRFSSHHIKRLIFHIFNICIIISLIIIFCLFSNDGELQNSFIFQILKIFISLRTFRIFILLDKFEIIQHIYSVIRISKEMLHRNLIMLYSFFFIFSTASIFLTGGNIKKNSFNDKNGSIPEYYIHINFNDLASSYITCICLMMINNINILVNSLTYNLNHKMFYKLYFATFYFFSTLIVINIIQTLLLEMYLISDNSSNNEDIKEDKNIDNKNNNKDENIIEEEDD